jgi:hypothetical protein
MRFEPCDGNRRRGRDKSALHLVKIWKKAVIYRMFRKKPSPALNPAGTYGIL